MTSSCGSGGMSCQLDSYRLRYPFSPKIPEARRVSKGCAYHLGSVADPLRHSFCCMKVVEDDEGRMEFPANESCSRRGAIY
jgi:hypothetical protein